MLSNIDKKSIFIFGDTKCGKSIICNNIINLNKDFKVIGGDYIIVSNKSIIGNSKSCLRTTANDEHYFGNIPENKLFINNAMYYPTTDNYIIFDIDINHKDNYFKILN